MAAAGGCRGPGACRGAEGARLFGEVGFGEIIVAVADFVGGRTGLLGLLVLS